MSEIDLLRAILKELHKIVHLLEDGHTPGPPASITIHFGQGTANMADLRLDQTSIVATAEVKDGKGNPIPGLTLTWAEDNTAAASMTVVADTYSATFAPLALGVDNISVTLAGSTVPPGTAVVNVVAGQPQSITVTLGTPT